MQILHIKSIFFFLALLLLIPSCEEIDEFPAEISLLMELDIDFEEENYEEDGDYDEDDLNISEVIFSITQIKIEAETENGERIMIQENIEESFELGGGESISLLDFNLPPAIYNYINVEIEINSRENVPSLSASGIFRSANAPDLIPSPVFFEYEAREVIKMNVEEDDNDPDKIVLKKDANKELTIEVEVDAWFETINAGQLNAAENIPLNGVNTIVISRINNPELYALISSRIRQSFSASF